MSAPAILARLTDCNVTLHLDGDVLVPRGPRKALTDDVLAELRRHKTEIVSMLQRRSLSSVDISDAEFAERVADLADAWRERIAICLEAGDISEAEAHRIAEAEIGAAFVRAFLPGEVAA